MREKRLAKGTSHGHGHTSKGVAIGVVVTRGKASERERAGGKKGVEGGGTFGMNSSRRERGRGKGRESGQRRKEER